MIVSQKSILDEVAKTTAYLGAKRGEYDRLATVDANDEILSRYWREAVAEAAVALGPAAEITLKESPIEQATVTVASGIDPALAESLLRAFLIERVVARWLALAGINPAEGKDTLATAHASAGLSQVASSLADLAAIANDSRSFTRPLRPF